MSALAFRRATGEMAVEAWRPLDRALYRWVLMHGGDTLLATMAAWTSFADGQGDAALSLTESRYGMSSPDAGQIEQLRASPFVATCMADGRRPFVLDAEGRFYLWRNHAHESSVAAAVIRRRAASAPAQADEADIDLLFGNDRSVRVAAQREAVRHVGGKRLFVLTGGPGTGKTTTVLRMLLMLQRRAERPLSIRIAAPTGKAAQRLVQALREGKAKLRDASLPPDWLRLLETIPDIEALTVHRLLGYQPWRNAFARGVRDPVAADVVVIDEASMVDLAMLRSLLDAVRPDATLILVGDADQLTSVATGSVLADVVSALAVEPHEDLVRLTHSFRAERHLVAVNEAVRAGDREGLVEALAASGGQARHQTVADERALHERLVAWGGSLAAVDALRPSLPPVAADIEGSAIDASRVALVRSALAELGRRQLLCALRETAFGTVAINAAIESLLRRAWQHDADTQWYPGRAVIVTRNDYAAGLFNGDIGLCLGDTSGRLRVWFETAGGVRGLAPHTLPAHESAFAITIHKSQGSEYAHAAVLLPPDAEHRILSRQLLYTGVSRAKQSVEIWCTPEVLDAALAGSVDRVGGLRSQLLG